MVLPLTTGIKFRLQRVTCHLGAASGVQGHEARTAAAVADTRLQALQHALERAEHRAQAAEQREATAQQTISHLLARPLASENASAEDPADAAHREDFSERP
jgi:hypothetical protein